MLRLAKCRFLNFFFPKRTFAEKFITFVIQVFSEYKCIQKYFFEKKMRKLCSIRFSYIRKKGLKFQQKIDWMKYQ